MESKRLGIAGLTTGPGCRTIPRSSGLRAAGLSSCPGTKLEGRLTAMLLIVFWSWKWERFPDSFLTEGSKSKVTKFTLHAAGTLIIDKTVVGIIRPFWRRGLSRFNICNSNQEVLI